MMHERHSQLERKYLFPAGLEDTVLDWLEVCCVDDPLHARGVVSSIYYDTPGLGYYRESSNGDYLRSKVRLRWYADPGAPALPPLVRCFLEVKVKRGAARDKQRLEVLLPAAALDPDPFSEAAILDLPPGSLQLGHRPPGALVPVLLIRYHRRRFVDPQSGLRIAVDTQICCPAVNHLVLPGLPPVYLDLGVVETKGREREPPEVFRPLQGLLVEAPFSKYTRCLEHLQQPLERRV